jgi:hypothetical protein
MVCLATAVLLTLAVSALARMERATVPVRNPLSRRPEVRRGQVSASPLRADRVSSPGSCTYGPRGL